jgi:hypothetical protein
MRVCRRCVNHETLFRKQYLFISVIIVFKTFLGLGRADPSSKIARMDQYGKTIFRVVFLCLIKLILTFE